MSRRRSSSVEKIVQKAERINRIIVISYNMITSVVFQCEVKRVGIFPRNACVPKMYGCMHTIIVEKLRWICDWAMVLLFFILCSSNRADFVILHVQRASYMEIGSHLIKLKLDDSLVVVIKLSGERPQVRSHIYLRLLFWLFLKNPKGSDTSSKHALE